MSRIGDVPGAAAVEHGQWIGATLMLARLLLQADDWVIDMQAIIADDVQAARIEVAAFESSDVLRGHRRVQSIDLDHVDAARTHHHYVVAITMHLKWRPREQRMQTYAGFHFHHRAIPMDERSCVSRDVDTPIIARDRSDIIARNHVDIVASIHHIRRDIPSHGTGPSRTPPIV